MAKDYYKTLGVNRDASEADIRKAYYDLAKKFHPDRNPDDKSAKRKFQEIQAAYDVIGNPEKRELYDRYGSSFETMVAGGPQGPGGHAGQQGPFGGGAAGGGFNPEGFDFSDFLGDRFGQGGGGFADLFSQFRSAGGKRARGGAQRGEDVAHEITIPFSTAVLGGEVELTVQRSPDKTETLRVHIPAGIDDGKKMRVRGQGSPAGRRGAPGDLLLTVRVAPHPCFQRRGNQLHVKLPITLAEAVGGAKIDVPTPHGVVTLSVPAGSSSGSKLRARGQGVHPAKGEAGDLIAELQIVLPKNMSEADRATICGVASRYSENPRSTLSW